MADYAIGDVQGCYDPLMRLLEQIKFDPSQDTLWFVGDLVNRGAQSLAVLRFIYHLESPPYIALGNHDLHFLARLFAPESYAFKDDTLDEILAAPDREILGHWLRQQPLIVYSESFSLVMCHAGIAPFWTLDEALTHAQEFERALSGNAFQEVLSHLYGNLPDKWSTSLTGFDRLRTICNYFTRMRCCDAEGRMDLTFKETKNNIPAGLYPWFAVPHRRNISQHIVFGHWAALEGVAHSPKIHPIDTGCVWGGALTALRLQDFCRFGVKNA